MNKLELAKHLSDPRIEDHKNHTLTPVSELLRWGIQEMDILHIQEHGFTVHELASLGFTDPHAYLRRKGLHVLGNPIAERDTIHEPGVAERDELESLGSYDYDGRS